MYEGTTSVYVPHVSPTTKMGVRLAINICCISCKYEKALNCTEAKNEQKTNTCEASTPRALAVICAFAYSGMTHSFPQHHFDNNLEIMRSTNPVNRQRLSLVWTLNV